MDIDNRTETADIRHAGYTSRLHRPLTQSRLFDAIASAALQDLARETRAAPAPEKVSVNGLHLLVAEDNEMNQFVTQETLRQGGCTCDIVADGLLAVQAAETQKYDAILMDCQMPGMDGLEATMLIRQHEAATPGIQRIPIIALTAEAIQGDREKCLAAGMDGYVTKPINADDLFATIRSLVGKECSMATPVAPAPIPAAPAIPAEAPIDVQALFTRCLNDGNFACQTLEKFQERAIRDVELLRARIAAGDVDGTTRLAHNLKAVAGHVAATPLRKIALEIEQAGERRDLQLIERQLTALEKEARRCAAYVPQAMQRLKCGADPFVPSTKSS
jgi:CheY-like chemotaxis protein